MHILENLGLSENVVTFILHVYVIIFENLHVYIKILEFERVLQIDYLRFDLCNNPVQ